MLGRRNIDHSPSDRSTPPPLDGWSPDRMAWSAAAAPRLMVWLRFMRRAQAGGPAPSADAAALAAAALGALSPVTAAPPATKLDCMLAAALRSGLTAAEPAASATNAIPPAR